MCVCCEVCVLSGRGLYDEMITHPEEYCRLWCVVLCDTQKPCERGGPGPLGRGGGFCAKTNKSICRKVHNELCLRFLLLLLVIIIIIDTECRQSGRVASRNTHR